MFQSTTSRPKTLLGWLYLLDAIHQVPPTRINPNATKAGKDKNPSAIESQILFCLIKPTSEMESLIRSFTLDIG